MKRDCTECGGYLKCSPGRIKRCIENNYSGFELAKPEDRKVERRKEERRK